MSHAPRDTDALRQALAENRDEPEGPARNAGAELLVQQAETTGDAPLLVDTLLSPWGGECRS
ncbi:hypothetical protein [Actinacidiphila oryziradicis]|uniref:hypothetical protein n=1 Tax=Actinacidiphila oryziradicis TaxID=2571141 RepID=UPI0023F1E637|nr:hypothetical protein [Actinacidiphila oryziradicis]MCW2870749.1 hypothetical protein [Actinacidiphila oryziradicis]